MMRPRWAALAAVAIGCTGRPHSPRLDPATRAGSDVAESSSNDKAGDVVEFDLSGGLHEAQGAGLLLPLPASRTYAGLVREVERAATNTRGRGFLIRLGGATISWAHGEELGLAFQRLREKTGKPIVCHAHMLDNRGAWFAARACSRVWLSPAGDVDTVGIGGQVVYLKGALDKLKIHADFLHMGKYKSAAEALTQEGPSEEARQSLTNVLGSIRRTWLDGYQAARNGKDLAAALEDGPWGAEEALRRGLVDAVGYEDDARHDAEERAHTHHVVTAFGGKHADESGLDVSALLRLITGPEGPTKKPHIAVVPAEGSITMGEGGLLSDSGITARAMQRVIRRLAADDAVKAVVLRIDSPGGSALASDLMWHDLMELRKKKPVIASVGDMAASGGYYLACTANKIVAERTSIVGSIGVLGGKIVIDEALASVGVHAETFPASTAAGAASRAAYLSPLSPWDDATREKVRRQMESVYELFLARVAEGRALPVESIRAVAEGRIWSGVQGQELRLVDELGGLGRALELARKLGSLDDEAPVRVEGLGETLLESLLVGDSADEATVKAAIAQIAERRHRVMDQVEGPVRPFVSSLAPLLEGEAAVAAMPFGLVVK
jgi:protease-4